MERNEQRRVGMWAHACTVTINEDEVEVLHGVEQSARQLEWLGRVLSIAMFQCCVIHVCGMALENIWGVVLEYNSSTL